MPKDKKPFKRLLRINDLLNLRKGEQAVVTARELMDVLGISRRQLAGVLKQLKELDAPEEYHATKRGYCYTDAFGFSDNIPLSAGDVLHLRIAVELLSKVNHLEGFQKQPEVFEKIRRSFRRWYVGEFSNDPSERFLRTFPLERIIGNPIYIGWFHNKPKDFDAVSYWRHIYGITIPPNGTLHEIVIEFSHIQGMYFLTSPFYEPFELVEQTHEKVVVCLKLIPNIDLLRKIASFVKEAKVIEPKSLIDD